MQRTIKAFFQPLAGAKSGKEEKAKSPCVAGKAAADTEQRDAGKQMNGSASSGESPVKPAARRIIRALDSDSEEEAKEPVADSEEEAKELVAGEPEGRDAGSVNSKQDPAATAPQVSPSRESPSSAGSSSHAGGSPVPSESPSPSGIPRRRTARKQFPKRKAEEAADDESFHGEQRTKRWRAEEKGEGPEEVEPDEMVVETPEVKSRSSELELSEKTGTAQEEEELRPEPAKPSKAISSFFAPRKAPAKAEKTSVPAAVEKPPALKGRTETSSHKNESVASSALTPVTLLDPTEYNPAKSKYHPVYDACWGPGERVPYLAVARTFERIEEESARLKIIETLSNLFRSVIALSPADLLPCVYLCLNRLGPAYEGLELGIGETILLKALAQATGRQLDQIKAEAAQKGDIGLVAESSRRTQRTMFAPPKLSTTSVFGKLQEIGRMTGSASMNKKIDIIKSLFVACRHSEARYIARSLGGKLRIGLAEQSVLCALAQAASLTPPGQGFPPKVPDASQGRSAESRKAWLDERALIVKQAFCELPNYDTLVPVLLQHGVESLPQHCKITPGIPLKPMLAHPTKGIGEVLKRFEEAAFTCEYKYDGERAQIHILESGEVHIYSRNQEDNTSKYPDIVGRLPKVKKSTVQSCILDTEAVAWDPETKQIQPFQVLTTRKRKDVDAAEIQVQVCVYAFDMLYLNGQSLVREPLCQRRALLHDSFVETEGQFLFATSMDTGSTDEIAEFLDRSIRDSCEGLMVKTLEVDATYEIAKRSHNWLKLKKDYLEGVGDTLDLVVIGAFLGKGKRVGTYGGFLLACYDEESEEFQSICKIGTGFTDEALEKHHTFLKDHVIPQPRPYYRWSSTTEPDHWLETQQVWEVKCADLSISPVHKAAVGLVDEEKGISLRFPRFLRIRNDKKPEDATTSTQVAELYRKQQQIQNQQLGEKGIDDDFY
uniref:DNA ligase n=1 Tax=Sphenodon punctatus TaxID=8508 RepID=A0A8D0LAJ0_SPHPU